jgi:hypothetical protein
MQCGEWKWVGSLRRTVQVPESHEAIDVAVFLRSQNEKSLLYEQTI